MVPTDAPAASADAPIAASAPIADNDGLAALCRDLAARPFVCLDTEFMREKTYYPRLCLVQLAAPDGEAWAVDPLAEGLDLAPLSALMHDESVLKVLHAGRQDIEIFYNISGRVPAPLFDTQVAAMVCGFGEAVAYERLARKIAKAEIDKSSRFTDWSTRPLTDRQTAYALADVAHLPAIYRALDSRLAETGRGAWLAEELAVLTGADTYEMAPERAWRRIKTRSTKPRFLGVLREVAAARESFAQKRDVPRNRVLRDESLLEIAAHEPADLAGLERIRGVTKGLAKSTLGKALLAAVERGRALPEDDLPRVAKPPPAPRGAGPVVELLKVLLKLRCEENDVAARLVASAGDLERLAANPDADVAAMRGWRRTMFGDDALALMRGDLALTGKRGRLDLVELEEAR